MQQLEQDIDVITRQGFVQSWSKIDPKIAHELQKTAL